MDGIALSEFSFCEFMFHKPKAMSNTKQPPLKTKSFQHSLQSDRTYTGCAGSNNKAEMNTSIQGPNQ